LFKSDANLIINSE